MLARRETLNREMTKAEILVFLENKGAFVQIDHLTSLLKQNLPIETRKFVALKLAELYRSRKMYAEASKMYNNAAVNTVAYKEQSEYYIEESKCWIIVGDFMKADESIKKALVHLNAKQRKEIVAYYTSLYVDQGHFYLKQHRYGHALQIYEKLQTMDINETEKHEIQRILLKLYEKLGKIQEYMSLKATLNKNL